LWQINGGSRSKFRLMSKMSFKIMKKKMMNLVHSFGIAQTIRESFSREQEIARNLCNVDALVCHTSGGCHESEIAGAALQTTAAADARQQCSDDTAA
jgi:hypothetical protein